MIAPWSLHFKKPFARIQEGWQIPDAVVVIGTKKHEIRPIKEENKDAYRIYSEYRNAHILIVDFYLFKLRSEWVSNKWHSA